HLYAGNRLKEYNGTEYTYDALGNLIYRQLPNGENQYFVYDTENQLTRAEIKKPAGNTEVWEYAYDPFGRRLSKERKDKLAWVSTEPKRTHFVWDGTRLLQEYTYKGDYTYVYTDQDSYEPLAQVFLNGKDDKQYLAYFHTDQIGIPREMTDQFGNLLWYGEYTAWGRLKKDERVYKDVHQPFRLQNQYCDAETGLHYNFFRYYEPDTGRFVNQDPIGLMGGDNLYQFASNAQNWLDPWGLWGFVPYAVAGLAAVGRAAVSLLSKAAKTGSKAVNKCLGKCWEPSKEAVKKIPKEWTKSPNKKGEGFRWQDPNNKGNGVRIDKGNPNHTHPTQQVDHVIVRSNGKVIGRDGNPISGSIKDDPQNAHIPLREYKKWKQWNSPN
ncbi:RHS repeat domain-containing protein, partial [Neisseria dentiae]|uniref:RHS repeat domain-containing protein n=2 Tax=Neisseria dentiae TaxID=194197 RepID=UPI00359F966D